MKIANKYFLVIVFLFSISYSCTDEVDKTEPRLSSDTKVKSKYNVLTFTPNVYHDYFKETENSIGFSSLKPNAFKAYSSVERTKFTENAKKNSFSVNNITLKSVTKQEKLNLGKATSIYGQTIRFNINNSNTKDEGTEVEMYVPELVEITNPKISNVEERYPLCDFSNFSLEWNADTVNEEGLVVIAEYFGANAVAEDSENIHILNSDFIETDDGQATLNPELFKDIPNLAVVHIVLLRGNVTIEEIQGELYKFYAESHMRLPITLVRDINTVKKID